MQKLKIFKKQVKTNKGSSGIVTPIRKFNRLKFHLKMFIELFTGKNLPSTWYIINNNLQAKDDQQIYDMQILLHSWSIRVPFIS